MQYDDVKTQLLERPMTLYQILAVAIGVMVNMMDGFDLLSISFAGPAIDREWMIGEERLGALFSIGLIGMASGALGLSWLSDVVGRRTGTMINLAVMATGMTFASVAPSFGVLFVARFVTGLGIGAMTASIGSLVFELASKKRREISLGFVTAAFSVGTLLGGWLARAWLLDLGWRAIFGFGAVISFLMIPIVFALLPESFDYLLGKQPKNALGRANRQLAKIGLEPLEALPAKAEVVISENASLMDVIRPPVLMSAVLACLGYFGFMTSQYFILNWMPTLMVSEGFTDSGAIGFAMIRDVGAIIGCLIVGTFTARLGVRPVTVALLLIMALAIAAFGALPLDAVQLIRTSSFFVGFAAFATAVGIFSIMASGYPSHVRSTGIGVAFTAGRLGAATGAYLGGFFWEVIGLDRAALCLVLAIPAVIAAFVVGALAKRNYGGTMTGVAQPVPE
ncbi:MAG: MFS transporter [Gammaproteobacteria bacterium]|jgi:MFS family permease